MADDILLFRSARHLDTAIGALSAHYPGSRITVVSNAGSERLLADAGVGPHQRLVGNWTHFSPRAVFTTAAGRALWRHRPSLVAVMWLDRTGRGHGNVTRTALMLSPRGFVAITPDGTLVRQPGWRAITVEGWRALLSMATATLVFIALVVPARVARTVGW